VKKYEQPGYALNNTTGTAGKQKSIQTPEDNVHVQEMLVCSPGKSVKP